MQRSVSAGSLVNAGVQQLSHMPKRATQHGCYMPSWEVPPTDLKPGQTSLTRQVYAEEAKRLEDTYINADFALPATPRCVVSVLATTNALSMYLCRIVFQQYVEQDRPADSHYCEAIAKILTPEAYKNPTKPILQKEPGAGYGHHGTAHWKSTSHAQHDPNSIAGAVYSRQHGPSYQAANPPTCVGAGVVHSTYSEFHGKYGSDPRHKVHPLAEKMPTFKTMLTVGTAKGTNHIPGYNGHLPMNTNNPHVARVASGATLRSVDKTNLTAQFQVNTLGYSGHVPQHPHNDRGGVKPSRETMMGRSFVEHSLTAFD
mmetsp:Transcript_167592/g.538210  ORF Transcript_167592/g.538210 Transcript_167592/m.538210 type:complete len:314 (+) Transcript_167592:107-1048(+)